MDMHSWLAQWNVDGQVAARFVENGFKTPMEVMRCSNLCDEDLRELGVAKMRPRMMIMRHVRKFNGALPAGPAQHKQPSASVTPVFPSPSPMPTDARAAPRPHIALPSSTMPEPAPEPAAIDTILARTLDRAVPSAASSADATPGVRGSACASSAADAARTIRVDLSGAKFTHNDRTSAGPIVTWCRLVKLVMSTAGVSERPLGQIDTATRWGALDFSTAERVRQSCARLDST